MTARWLPAIVGDGGFDEPIAGVAVSPSHDEALLAGLRAGEGWAVGEAYDAHHAGVRAFARRLVGEVAAAEDMVHEVFVSLPRAIRRFRGKSSLRTFLLSIAVNHARHHVRAAARRRRAMERFALEPHVISHDPHAQHDLARALSSALDTLPIDQRVAFVLCEVEERSASEVAGIVDAPEGTIRTRLFAAKRKLRLELEREGLR